MHFFKRFLRTVHNRPTGILTPPESQAVTLKPPKPQIVALESSVFRKLPYELILAITSFLPKESVPSFSLCCRPIHFILGTQKLDVEDIYKFLTLLERDLPLHVLCLHCEKLHAIDKAHRYIPPPIFFEGLTGFELERPCLKANALAYTSNHFHKYFSFVVFQMTMKAHRQGLDCAELLSLLSYPCEIRYNRYYTALARLAAGSLFLREQSIYHAETFTRQGRTPRGPFIEICSHTFFHPVDGLGYYHYTERMGGTPVKDYRNLKGVSRCRSCHTEFQIVFSNLRKQDDSIMTITTWKDLGEGLSFSDLRYQRHLHYGMITTFLPQAEYEQRSIRAMFEGEDISDYAFDGAWFPSPSSLSCGNFRTTIERWFQGV